MGATARRATTMRRWFWVLLAMCGATPAQADAVFANGFEGCAVATTRFTLLPWSSLYISQWPSHPGGVIEFNDSVDITYALEFTATATPLGYGVLFAQEVPGGANGAIAMAISSSPGCLDPGQIAPACFIVGVQPALGWKTVGTVDYCPLTIGQRYYFNFSYGTQTMPPGPFCDGACVRRLASFIQ